MSLDVLFVTDANVQTGFGHVARCLAIARLLDPALGLGFQGVYSAGARARIKTSFPGAQILEPGDVPPTAVAFIDRLAHPDVLDADDPAFVEEVEARAGHVILLSSGTRSPTLPEGVVCVGYQPADVTPHPPHLLWGFAYAPVPAGLVDEPGPPREASRLLIALGGHPDDTLLRRVLGEVASIASIRDVDVLLSPVMAMGSDPYRVGSDQTLQLHRDVPSVAPLLRHAGAVIASYGNLVYEALALGAPVCVVGQKAFQVALGDALARRDLVVCAGAVAALEAGVFRAALEDTFAGASRRGALGRSAVDGQGLARLAALIQCALGQRSIEERS